MKQKENMMVNVYRKRFKPVLKRDIESEINNFVSEYLTKPTDQQLHFALDKLESNEDLRIVYFAKPDALRRHLIELGNHGADIKKIYNLLTLPPADSLPSNVPPHALRYGPSGEDSIHGGELAPEWNERVAEFNQKKKEFVAWELKLSKAFENVKILIDLEPVSIKDYDKKYSSIASALPFVNDKLSDMQNALREFERVLDIYCEGKAIEAGLLGYAVMWGWRRASVLNVSVKPVEQSSHISLLDSRIFSLVTEIRNLEGYTLNKTYEIVAELLNISFPHLYKDKNPDLVRSRYTYFKKSFPKK